MHHSDHHSDGTFRAFLDGELDARLTRELTRHLGSCAECRGRLDSIDAQGRAVSRLLDLATPARRPYPRVIAAAAVVLISAAVLTLAARQFPATHTRLAGESHVQDICCFNLDGGGRGDDGMLTISRPGQIVDCVVLYEDRTGTRAFSPHDPVRFISRPAGCDVSGS